MATISWATGVTGNWTKASNWKPAQVPGDADNAIMGAVGTYTVTSGSDETVNTLTTAKTATLSITGGSGFVMLNGTGTGSNAGTISIDDNSILEAGGAIKNTGVIALNSTGDTTDFVIDGNVMLAGGGKVNMNGPGFSISFFFPGGTVLPSPSASIVGNGAPATLTNVDNTITGAGIIGDSDLSLLNQKKGVINATGSDLALAGNVTNAGTIEATSAIDFLAAVDNTGGTIKTVQKGSFINLYGVTINGGTISTVSGSTLAAIGNFFLPGEGSVSLISGGTVTNAGALVANSGASLTVQSAITNNGVLRAIGNLAIDGPVTGSGSATIVGTGTLEIGATFAENVSFTAGATGTLKLDALSSLTGTVHGFGANNVFDFANVGFGAGTTFSYTPNGPNTGGVLHVTDGTRSASIGLFGHYAAADFQDASDGNGGTLLGYAIPISWKSGVNGDFAVTSNWNPAKVPGAANDAVINAAGTYTVTSSANETVGSLTTVATATLAITSGTFTVVNRFGSVTNAGTITIAASANSNYPQLMLSYGGVINNTGTIAVSGNLAVGNYATSG